MAAMGKNKYTVKQTKIMKKYFWDEIVASWHDSGGKVLWENKIFFRLDEML